MIAVAGAVVGLGPREAGLVTPGARGNARGNPTAESPRAFIPDVTAGWGNGREDATGRYGLSAGQSVRPHLEGGLQAMRSAVDRAGSGEQKTRMRPLGNRFQSLGY